MRWLQFRLLYWFGKTRWDSGITPPEVVAAFQENQTPPGRAIDLGCGTGTNAIFLAKLGWQVVGIDFVPEAIAQARKKAKQAGVSTRARFFVGDVTHLHDLPVQPSEFALDIGCFHGLSLKGRQEYISALAKIIMPGGRYMLYVIDPRLLRDVPAASAPDYIRTVFSPWFDITHFESGSFGDRRSTWFWLDRIQT